MCSRLLRCFRKRSGRVHAGQDTDMPANDSSLTMQHQHQQQQQRVIIVESNTSLQREVSQSTPTHAAAVNGDKSALTKLISNHYDDINAGDQFGRTPLILAVLADRLECAETLIKHGAKVNSYDNAERTALHWASYKGNTRLCKLLLAKGANWKIKDKEGQTALHLATRHDNTKCLMLLIKQLEPGEQDEQDNANRTALHWSSSYGNEEAVKLLIKHNSNIGIPDTDGKTPLHWAASAGHSASAVNTVQLILDTEPSVITWQDYEGRTALHLAVAQGNETIAQQLINFQTTLVTCNVSVLDNMFRTPLHWAAVLGHTHIVNLLLDAGANVSSSDANGATPLHYAAQNNHAETVAAFLSRDSITDEPDLEGRTALMWAAGKGADDVISCMVEITQPDINATDKTGATALHAAAMCGHPSTIQVLLELGANVNILDQSKHTPLFRAAEMGHTSVVKVLIQGGAQVDIVDQEGRSPIHWAALGGHTCICSILIGEDINPNIQDFTGRTPLQCANYGGFTNSILLLLEKGADPNSQDSEGMTALHWCCSSGYLNAAKLLLEHGAFPNHMEYSEEHLTPLDYTLQNEHHHVAQYMIEQGALSITGIRDIAAIRVQAYFRGYRVRKTFVDRKKLLMKHEQLRKDAAKKKVEMTKKNETEEFCPKDDNKVTLDGDKNQTGVAKAESDGEGTTKGDDDEGAGQETKQPMELCWDTETPRTEDELITGDNQSDEGYSGMAKVDGETHSPDPNGSENFEHGGHENDPKQMSAHKKQASYKKSHSSKAYKLKATDVVSEHTDAQVGSMNENSNNSNNTELEKSIKTMEKLRVQDGGMCLQEPDKCTVSTSKNHKASLHRHHQWTFEERREVVEKERHRLAFWRKRNSSAAVIQRSWRNFKQTELNDDTIHKRHQQPSNCRANHRAEPRTDTDKAWCHQQIAACTIQQAWRSYRGTLPSDGNKKFIQKLEPQLKALGQTLVLNKIYAERQVPRKAWRASLSVRRTRPQSQQYFPSAAASSFNFAVDQYQPIVRNVKTPSNLRQSSHQIKHPSPNQNSNQSDGDRVQSGSRRSSKSARHYSYNHH